MRSCSPSPTLARTLFFTTIFIFSLLVAVSIWNCVTYYTPQENQGEITDASVLTEQPFAQDVQTQSHNDKRGLGVGSLSDIVPSALSVLVPGTATALEAEITDELNGLGSTATISLPILKSSEGLPILSNQPIVPLTTQPKPTSAEAAQLFDEVSSSPGDIVSVRDSPVSLVGDLNEYNVCTITTTVNGVLSTLAGLCGNMDPTVPGNASGAIMDLPASSTQASLNPRAFVDTILPFPINTDSGITITAPPVPASADLNPGASQSITSSESATDIAGSITLDARSGSDVAISSQDSIPCHNTSPAASISQDAGSAQPGVESTCETTATGGNFRCRRSFHLRLFTSDTY